MRSVYIAAHALTLGIALLVFVASFVMMLFGWTLHGLIAALVFSSCATLAQQLRLAAVSPRLARLPPSTPAG